MSKGLKVGLIIVAILVLLVAGVASWVIGGYNQAISFDEAVKGQWAQVENQLKRRYDLIPNLVETVKGYAKHEKELFENIAQARTKYFQQKSIKGQIEASKGMELALSKLLLLREQYPQLKARFFAGLAGVEKSEYYELPQGEAETPKVKFGN
jgi:LemA protein